MPKHKKEPEYVPMDIRHPPNRVWYRTESGKYCSREWLPGEAAAYVREVLVKLAPTSRAY